MDHQVIDNQSSSSDDDEQGIFNLKFCDEKHIKLFITDKEYIAKKRTTYHEQCTTAVSTSLLYHIDSITIKYLKDHCSHETKESNF